MLGTSILGTTPLGMSGGASPPPSPPVVEEVEVLLLASEIILLHDEMVEDSVSALDETAPSGYAPIVETALASDASTSVVRRVLETSDVANATDATVYMPGALLDSTVQAVDVIVTLSPTTVEVEATAVDDTTTVGSPETSIVSAASAVDDTSVMVGVLADAVSTAADGTLVSISALIESVATGASDVLLAAAGSSLVTDTTTADDAQAIRTPVAHFIDDGTLAKDAVLYPQPELTAWVMNTETAAVSWYTNWGFTGMAQVGNRIFAVGPAGLVELGDSRDDSARINARVEYDFNEFGGYDREGNPLDSEYKKRVENFWVGYVADGRLKFQVETYGQGYGVVNYVMEPRTAAQPRNSRVKPGKGLNARWWKVAIENVAGANFEITSLSADVAQSNRRA